MVDVDSGVRLEWFQARLQRVRVDGAVPDVGALVKTVPYLPKSL